MTEVRDLDIVRAAHAWWMSRRPVGWMREQHIENPTVNCTTDAEKALAEMVARWCQ